MPSPVKSDDTPPILPGGSFALSLAQVIVYLGSASRLSLLSLDCGQMVKRNLFAVLLARIKATDETPKGRASSSLNLGFVELH